MIKALVEHRTFAVDRVLSKEYPPNVDLSRHKGKSYSCRAPAPSYLGVPIYYLASLFIPVTKMMAIFLLRLCLNILPSLVFLFFFYRFLGNFSQDVYFRSVLLVGLAIGSLFFTYGIILLGHQQATIGLFGAFMLTYANKKAGRDRQGLLALSGFLMALAVASEYQTFFSSLILFVYAWLTMKRKSNIVFVLLGGLIPVGLTLYYHYACFDSIFKTGQHYLTHKPYQIYQTHGLKGFFYFSWQGAWGTFFSPANGLFFYSPWLIFFLPGLITMARRRELRAETVCITLILAYQMTFVASMYAWKAGWTVGPRYLTCIVPFLLIPILFYLESSRKRFQWIRSLFLAFLLYSLIVYALSTLIFPHFPEWLHNPFFELILPLVRANYYPYNLGRLFGLSGFFSVLPYYLVLLMLCGYLLWANPVNYSQPARLWRRIIILGCIVTITVAIFFGVSLPRTQDGAQVKNAIQFAQKIWEPKKPENKQNKR